MTIEELEAKLEIVTKHRDAWKKMLDETNRHVLDLAALVEPGLHRHPVTVLQATHAFILNLMNERDEAKKEAAESSKEMIMLFNDHSSIELEKQLRIEQLTRERDKFQALAELGEGYRRERDEARAEVGMLEDRLGESRSEVDRLTDERDELLVRVADQGAELRATREAYGAAYRRGAEAMRRACMGWCKTWENDGEAIADALADLSIPGEP
jgi:DNA repair exonuclease SbcCD ATPase subunit